MAYMPVESAQARLPPTVAPVVGSAMLERTKRLVTLISSRKREDAEPGTREDSSLPTRSTSTVERPSAEKGEGAGTFKLRAPSKQEPWGAT